jgi:hypothetical protein
LIASASTAKTTNDTQDGRLTNLESKSGSVDTRLTEIGVVSGSLISSASTVLTRFNAFSSSFDTAFDISGTNVTIAGNLTVAGTQTIVDSTTVQIGDNIIELNGSGAANGGLLVKDPTAPNTVSGSLLWDSTNDYWKAGALGSESKLLRAEGDNVVSGGAQILITDLDGYTAYNDNILEEFSASNASIAALSASVGAGAGVAITNLNSFSSSTLGRLSNIELFSSSAETRFTEIGVVSGSLIASASTAKTTNDSQGVSITNLNTFSGSTLVSLAELNTFSGSQLTKDGTLATYTASVDTRLTEIGVVSGSLIASASTAKTTNDSQGVSITNINTFSGSQLTQNSTLATYTASVDTRLTEIGVVSGSLITSASNAKTTNDSQDVSITNLNTFTSSFTSTFSTSVDSRLDTLEGTGTIQGVGTSNNVTFAKVTTTGDVVVGGDLVVQGNTVTLNTATLIVEDKLITLASGSTSSATADGSGFEVAGAGANFIYQHSTTSFTSSVALIAPAVTSSFNLGSAAGSSKRVAFRNTNGNLDLVPTGSVSGDLLQWDGTDFVMSNVIDGGSF